jgi:3-isopropylmalate dehydrogenase
MVSESKKALDAVAARYDFKVAYHSHPFGGEHYLKHDELLPDSALEEMRSMDGILFGALGHPDVKPGILERGILMRLRVELDQYIHLRPVRLFPGVASPLKDKGPEQIDFVVVRENTGGIYSGVGGVSMRGSAHEVATESMVYSRMQVERCVSYAFDYALKSGRKRELSLCGKSSFLTYVGDLWDRVYEELGERMFPEVNRSNYHIDEMCMLLVKRPEMFDVIVAPNMFGDILADLGAVLQGGVGYATCGNINPEGVSMFGPIGADFRTEVNTPQRIVPVAAVSAVSMLLENLGETEAADQVDSALMFICGTRLARTFGAYGSSEIGDMIAEQIVM